MDAEIKTLQGKNREDWKLTSRCFAIGPRALQANLTQTQALEMP